MSQPRSVRRALGAGTAFALMTTGLVAVATPATASAAPPASLTALDTAYTQNFDSLVASGTGTEAANTPTGWTFVESGTNANTSYTAGTGSGNSGDTYSFGAAGSSDRALGGLQSGSLVPTVGAFFTNDTGGRITSLDIAYTGEQWRLGTTGRADRIDFQWSSDASSLTTGTWADLNALDFTSPSTTTAGPLDGNAPANRSLLASTITGIDIPPGGTLAVRWSSFDAAGADDGLAVDDFSLTPHGIAGGTETDPSGTGAATPGSVVQGGTTTLTVDTTPGTNPASTGLAVTADLTAIGGSAATSLKDDGVAPDAAAGDGTFSVSATVAAATAPGSKSVPFTVTDGQGRSGSGSIAVTVTSADPCAAPDEPIGSVQTSGSTGLTGQHTVQGVVVGDYEGASPALRGFYLQDQGDGDPATSDGIFVFEGDNANRVSVGDVVQVTGGAGENQGQTQISSTTGIAKCGTTDTVPFTHVTLPLTSPDDLERYEGMLVDFPQQLSVTEHFQLGRFGQVTLSEGGRLQQPTNVVAPGAPANALQAQNDLRKIILDDASQAQNPDPIVFGRGGQPLSASNTLRGGDTVTGLHGVLTYTWGGNGASPNAYRVRPIGSLGGVVPDFQPANPRPTAPPVVGGSLRAVGMNLLNYFNDFSGCTGGVNGPSMDCRGAESQAEFDRQWPKTVSAIQALDADVIGVNEIENNGYGPESSLAHLVGKLNDRLGPGTYAYLDVDALTGQVDAMGGDAIKVGVLYKPAKVTPVGTTAVLNSTAFVNGGDSAPRNRATVAQAFLEKATGGRFVFNVNHLKSKGSICDGEVAGDPHGGQGNCNQVRLNAVHTLTEWLASDPTRTGDPDTLLVGDYNSYAMEDPIRALEDAGYVHLIKSRLGPDAYSYVFDGQWGYLDHSLASASLDSQVAGVADYHINSDEPSVLDYNTNFKTPALQASLYAPDQYRVSDHDPVLVGLSLTREKPSVAITAGLGCVADAGGRFALRTTSIDGAAVTVTASSSDGTVVRDSDIAVSGDGDDRVVSLSTTGRSGTAVVTLTATDAQGAAASTTITVRVGTNAFDTITGGAGADLVIGGNGDDTLSGGGGADVLCGGRGNDRLSGDAGNDALSGGQGDDTLTGGTGADAFDGGQGRDVATDVSAAEGDTTVGIP